MYLGIDIGTSALKVVLVDENGKQSALARMICLFSVRAQAGQNKTHTAGGRRRITPLRHFT